MVRLTDRPDMTLDVYRGRKTTTQQQLIWCSEGSCFWVGLLDNQFIVLLILKTLIYVKNTSNRSSFHPLIRFCYITLLSEPVLCCGRTSET